MSRGTEAPGIKSADLDILDRFGVGAVVRDPNDRTIAKHAFHLVTDADGRLESPYCEACGGGLLNEVHQQKEGIQTA